MPPEPSPERPPEARLETRPRAQALSQPQPPGPHSPPVADIRPGDRGDELKVFDHGFVRLDDSMADDLSVVNGARVSFAVRKETMDERDAGLIKFLMRSGHGSPFEHNSFRFHIRCPIFVAREWFRHRMGCLAGDTRISFVAAPPSSKTMEELWQMWARGGRAGQRSTALGSARAAIQRMRLRVWNEINNEFESGHISEVVNSGPQALYRLTLADGKRLEATENHRLLTPDGWTTLREAVGLLRSGEYASMSRSCRLITNGVPAQDRGLAPAHESSGCFSSWEGRPAPRGYLTGRPVAVVAVDYLGVRQTYDLCVEGPWHNFVANGIVVHNSFNEESARYHKLEGDFYVPSPEAVRTQVGKPGAYTFQPLGEDLAADTIATFRRVYGQLYGEYQALVDRGVAKELARSLLPFGIYTQFYWTLNARSLMNFLALRNSPEAQYEIRVYAQAVEQLFAQKMPVTHACFVEFGRKVP